MPERIPFGHVLSFLNEHGWEFTGIWKPYRVFNKRGQLTILVEVHRNTVDHEDVERIETIIAKEYRDRGEDDAS